MKFFILLALTLSQLIFGQESTDTKSEYVAKVVKAIKEKTLIAIDEAELKKQELNLASKEEGEKYSEELVLDESKLESDYAKVEFSKKKKKIAQGKSYEMTILKIQIPATDKYNYLEYTYSYGAKNSGCYFEIVKVNDLATKIILKESVHNEKLIKACLNRALSSFEASYGSSLKNSSYINFERSGDLFPRRSNGSYYYHIRTGSGTVNNR